MLNISKLYDLTALGIKNASVRIVGSLQKEQPEQVVAAIATVFLAVCKRYRLDVRQVLDVTYRIIRDAQDKHPVEMRAMARYLREELPDV